jgi:hypothetical protein
MTIFDMALSGKMKKQGKHGNGARMQRRDIDKHRLRRSVEHRHARMTEIPLQRQCDATCTPIRASSWRNSPGFVTRRGASRASGRSLYAVRVRLTGAATVRS